MKYDHMLNGAGSRNHHQHMIAEAQHQKLLEVVSKNDQQRKGVPQRVKQVAIAVTQLLVK